MLAKLDRVVSVLGCSSPRTRRWMSNTLEKSSAARAYWFCRKYVTARRFMLSKVSGCCSPSTRRWTSSTLADSCSACSYLPWRCVQLGQIAHRQQRLRILLAEDTTSRFQRLREQRLRLRILALPPVYGAEVVHAEQRLSVILAEVTPLDLERFRLSASASSSHAFHSIDFSQTRHGLERIGVRFT